MKKGIIYFLIFIVILIIGLVLLYFLYERPTEKQEADSYAVLNIYADYNESNIVTGYKVYVNNLLYSNGTTLLDGFSYQKIPTNASVLVQNYNLANQNYYTSEYNEFITSNSFYRVHLDLKEPGKLNITQTGRLNGSPVYLNVTAVSGDFKGLRYCVYWSIHIITVRINETRLDSEERCYDTSIDLNSTNNYYLTLDYNYYNKLDKADFIKVVFFDDDCAFDVCAIRQNNYTVNVQY